MNKKHIIVGSAAAITLLVGVPVFAATTATSTSPTSHFAHKGGFHKFSGVFGTVTAINGDTLTVSGKNGQTYTVDITNATIQKGFGKSATTISAGNIAVNDTVAVQGTVNGSSVTAQKVMDGIPQRPANGTSSTNGSSNGMHGSMMQQLANAAFGTVQSVNGSVITLSHKTKSGTSSVTVTTTASTTYKKNGQADTASDITVGDRIVAMGTKDSEGNITNATSVNIFTFTPHQRTATSTASSQ